MTRHAQGSHIDVRELSMQQRLDLPLAQLAMSVRTINMLEGLGLMTVGQLLQCQPGYLSGQPGIKVVVMQEIFDALERVGFYRRGRRPQDRLPDGRGLVKAALGPEAK